MYVPPNKTFFFISFEIHFCALNLILFSPFTLHWIFYFLILSLLLLPLRCTALLTRHFHLIMRIFTTKVSLNHSHMIVEIRALQFYSYSFNVVKLILACLLSMRDSYTHSVLASLSHFYNSVKWKISHSQWTRAFAHRYAIEVKRREHICKRVRTLRIPTYLPCILLFMKQLVYVEKSSC